MSWTDEAGGVHPSMGDLVTAEGLEHIDNCPRCRTGQPQTVDSETSTTPGSDWLDVPEGTEYTPEQAARKFLSMPWQLQVVQMERFLANTREALACRMLNHEGAHIFATQHTCHDRYREGWEDALKELGQKVEEKHGG